MNVKMILISLSLILLFSGPVYAYQTLYREYTGQSYRSYYTPEKTPNYQQVRPYQPSGKHHKFFIPPGATYVTLTYYFEIGIDGGVAVRYGRPPECNYSKVDTKKADLPWSTTEGTTLPAVWSCDYAGRVIGGHASILNGEVSSDWWGRYVYVKVLSFEGSPVVNAKFGVQYDPDTYKAWWRNTAKFTATGDPKPISKASPPSCPGFCEPWESYEPNGNNGDIPTPPPSEKCNPILCLWKGGTCIDGECVVKEEPEPEPPACEVEATGKIHVLSCESYNRVTVTGVSGDKAIMGYIEEGRAYLLDPDGRWIRFCQGDTDYPVLAATISNGKLTTRAFADVDKDFCFVGVGPEWKWAFWTKE